MKSKLFFVSFLLGGMGASAQTDDLSAYAEPAFRSPLVAVEFTGQRCRYCPDLSRALKEKQEKYGEENYIIAALHNLEEYSKLPSSHVSLFNEECKKYAASIEIHTGLPQLVYNTLGPAVSDHLLDDMFKEDDLMECTGNVWYNDNNEYVFDVNTRLRRNRLDFIKDKKIDILFWALENDIVALQDDNGKWTFPAHQHIFRGSINGTWGERFEIGSAYKKTWTVPSSVSVLDNSEVVAFFLDRETKTIYDAARFKVSKLNVTGIEDENIAAPGKVGTTYDMSGREVQQPAAGGVYIKNGKKYILK